MADWRGLAGRRVLLKPRNSGIDSVVEARIVEVTPSGGYIKLGLESGYRRWISKDNMEKRYEFIEVIDPVTERQRYEGHDSLFYKQVMCWNKNCKNNDGFGHCKLPHVGIDENGRCMDRNPVKVETKKEQIPVTVDTTTDVDVSRSDQVDVFGSDQ